MKKRIREGIKRGDVIYKYCLNIPVRTITDGIYIRKRSPSLTPDKLIITGLINLRCFREGTDCKRTAR